MVRAGILLILVAMLASACAMTEDYKTKTYTEPLNDSESAQLTLVVPFQNATIRAAQSDSEDLFKAVLQYIGRLDYRAGDSNNKVIYLEEKERLTQYGGDKPLSWLVWLSPAVAFDLDLTFNTGTVQADMTGLNLSNLNLHLNQTRAEITLPVQEEPVATELSIDGGELTFTIPAETAVDLNQVSLRDGSALITIGEGIDFDGNISLVSGDLTLEISPSIGVQINVEEYVGGKVNVPSSYEQVMESTPESQEGIWQSPDFDNAEFKIMLSVSIEDGNLIVR